MFELQVDILEAVDSKRGSYGVLSMQSSTSIPTDSAFLSVENVWADSSAVQGADICVETCALGTVAESSRTVKPIYKVKEELNRLKGRTRLRTGTLWDGIKRL